MAKSKKLKHIDLIKELDLVAICPYSNCDNIEIDAFHFTNSTINTNNCLIPIYLRDKINKKVRRYNSMSDLQKCSYCGISFYNSFNAAIKKYSYLPKHIQNIMGFTHIAKGKLLKTDGIASQINNEGHFDFFEYEGVELSKKFSIIGELK